MPLLCLGSDGLFWALTEFSRLASLLREDPGFGYTDIQHPRQYCAPNDVAQYARALMQQGADLMLHQHSMASMITEYAQGLSVLEDFEVAPELMGGTNCMPRPSGSVASLLSTDRGDSVGRPPATVQSPLSVPTQDAAHAPSTVRASTQLGGPMKPGPPSHKQPHFSTLEPSEYDRVLDMPTTDFNRLLKATTITQEESSDLRMARRRKNNRLYAKRARSKKLIKLNELQATVAHLSSLTASLDADDCGLVGRLTKTKRVEDAATSIENGAESKPGQES
jgi:hypothetical protein